MLLHWLRVVRFGAGTDSQAIYSDQIGGVTVDMSELLSTIAQIVAYIVSWIGDFANVITSTPIILLFVVLAVAGVAVGFLRRLMRL